MERIATVILNVLKTTNQKIADVLRCAGVQVRKWNKKYLPSWSRQTSLSKEPRLTTKVGKCHSTKKLATQKAFKNLQLAF